MVIDPTHLKEYFEDQERSLSFFDAALEDIDFESTLPGNVLNFYHVHVIRNQLTQNIARLIPTLAEELDNAFRVEIDTVLGAGMSQIGLR